MRTQLLSLTAVFVVAAAAHGGEKEKVYEVGKDGVKITGELGKVSAITYKVKLVAGKTYVIDMISPDQKALIPSLHLLDAKGKQLAENNNAARTSNAQLVFRPKTSSTYRIVARTTDQGRGPFTLTVLVMGLDSTPAKGIIAPEERKDLLLQAKKLEDSMHEHVKQGQHQQAIGFANQALRIYQRVLGEKHADYVRTLNNLAFLWRENGDYAKAEPLFVKSLEIRKEIYGEKHAKYAQGLHNLASLYRSKEEYVKAEALFIQSMIITKEVLGERHQAYAYCLNGLSGVYLAQGAYAKAEPLLVKSLEIREHTLGEKHPETAESLNNLAVVSSLQGKYAKAELLYLKSLAIKKEIMGEKHFRYAQGLNNLGHMYQSQGEIVKAKQCYRQAISAIQISHIAISPEKLQVNDLHIHSVTVSILRNHARLAEASATKSEAIDQLRSRDHCLFLALNVLNQVRQVNLDKEESKIQLTTKWFDLVPDRIKVLNQLVFLDPQFRDLESAFLTAEQGTARAFLEAFGRSRANLFVGLSSKLQADESRVIRHIGLLDLYIEKESGKTLDERTAGLLEKLFEDRQIAEANLKKMIAEMEKEYPRYAAFKHPTPCKLEEARDALLPGETAMIFLPGTSESYIILVEASPRPDDKSNGLAIIEIPKASNLADLVAPLIDQETLSRTTSAKAYGRQAFDAILGPAKDRIKDKNLVIVPNGQLCFLPFEMLVEPDGKYLVEKHRIRYAPSLTALHFINLWKKKRAEPEVELFAVGDPIYGKEYQRLEHSGYEVAEIAKLFKAKDEFVLTRGKASKSEVKKLSDANTMAKARYVHFATHGILGLDRGKQPALVLNQTGKDVEESYLQMDEITSLKLNADLVVLSACKSGQGRLHQGEGVTGIARAFLYAGSKGVMCSLWSVDDRETANLMVDFYGHLKNGKSAPEALRESQLAMIRAGKAPLYWAPFIVIGE